MHYSRATMPRAEYWAPIASLIETCKQCRRSVDLITATLNAILIGRTQRSIDELLPWNYSGNG